VAELDREVGGKQYHFNMLNLFAANDVARMWSYALIMLAKSPADLKAEDFAKAFPTFVTFVPKADHDYVMSLCLATVKRAVGGDKGWAPLIGSNGQMMYQDISLSEMYQLIFYCLEANQLLHFFGEPPAPSAGEAEEASS
jgi:hypothetical protein